MLQKIDHIGIVVHSIAEIKKFYKTIFNLDPDFEEEVEEQKVRVVCFRVGESHIEFLEPMTETSPISRFLTQRGEGLHHVAYSVENISKVLQHLKNQGIILIDEEPRPGAEGKLIAFVHPRSMHGVLIELSQDIK